MVIIDQLSKTIVDTNNHCIADSRSMNVEFPRPICLKWLNSILYPLVIFKKVVSLLLTLSLIFVIMSMEHSSIYQQSRVLGQTSTEGPSIESGTNDTQGLVDSFDVDGTISSLAVDTLVGSDTSMGTHTGDL